MQTICRSALVPFSTQQMFKLVDDIENYKNFVPHCQQSTIIERNDNQVIAKLQIAKSGLNKSFTTKNTLVPYQSIQMELLDGPFSYLSGGWQFTELNEKACKIEFSLNFEFSNALTSFAFSKIFNQLISSMISAFIQQAKKNHAE